HSSVWIAFTIKDLMSPKSVRVLSKAMPTAQAVQHSQHRFASHRSARPDGRLKDPFTVALFLLVVFSLSRLPAYILPLSIIRITMLLFVFCVGYASLHPRRLR